MGGLKMEGDLYTYWVWKMSWTGSWTKVPNWYQMPGKTEDFSISLDHVSHILLSMCNTARWSLVTGSVILKWRCVCWKCVACQDRWSLMAVVSQDRFHCSGKCQVTSNNFVFITRETHQYRELWSFFLSIEVEFTFCEVTTTPFADTLVKSKGYVCRRSFYKLYLS